MSKKKILFLCVANSARSQMAEGLGRKYLGDEFEIFSAGSTPSRVHPVAILVMKEIGIDLSDQYSKSVETYRGEAFDYVITLCDEEVCPLWVGLAIRLHWSLTDPAIGFTAKDQEKTFRQIRDELTNLIQGFKLKLPLDPRTKIL